MPLVLQLSESAGNRLSGRAATLDSHLAAIDDAVACGDLSHAAVLLDTLPKGLLQADAGAAAFARALRTRALAEQSAVLLNAHASLLAGTAV